MQSDTFECVASNNTCTFNFAEKETQTSNASLVNKYKDHKNLLLPRSTAECDKISLAEFEILSQEFESPKSTTLKGKLAEESLNTKKQSTVGAVSNINNCNKEVVQTYSQLHLQDRFNLEEDTVTSFNYKLSWANMDNKTGLPKPNDSSLNIAELTASARRNLRELICGNECVNQKCNPQSPNETLNKEKIISASSENASHATEENKLHPKVQCPLPITSYQEQNFLNTGVKKSVSSLCGLLCVTDTIADKKPEMKEKEPPMYTTVIDTDAKEEAADETHGETLFTIKTAMEDFITKVYRKTQDAVTVVKTESVKQFELFRKSTSSITEDAQPKVSCDSKESFTGFSFINRVESKDKKDADNIESSNTGEIFDGIVGKVESTVSIITEYINVDKFSEMLKPSKFNDINSTYDESAPPKDVSHAISGSGQNSNSMFATLKSRIFSMFYESDDKTNDDTVSSTSSSSSPPSRKDSDEDLINKLIE